MDIDIRHATADDAVDIAALRGELGYAQYQAALRSRLEVLTSDGHVVSVAVAD